MTFNSSSTKPFNLTRNLMLHTLRSYWWLAVICSVVYGFAGPVYNLLKLSDVARNRGNNNAQNAIFQMANWLSDTGFVMLYGSVVVLAAIIGCVVFFYLHKKQQVNFYHSQPVTRTRLFAVRYITGLVVTLVPLVVMTGVTVMLVIGYQYGAVLDAGGILHHMMNMVLLALASYSIAVLSAQLTGMSSTHAVLNAILHFAVPAAAVMVYGMFNIFFATYADNLDVTPWLRFSPFCAMVYYLDTGVFFYGTTGMELSTMHMRVASMDILTVAVLCGITLLGSGAALWLYSKRPSEAADKAMVYPITEPVLKAFLMFMISMAAGMVFLLAGYRAFFYFAVVAFAILTHMTCEVILRQDFRAMGHNLRQCAVILLLILAVIGCMRFDVFHYDTWMPQRDNIDRIALVVRNADAGSLTRSTQDVFSSDAEVIDDAYSLLQPIIANHAFAGSEFATVGTDREDIDNTTTVEVSYALKNGKNVTRHYMAVPVAQLQDSYRALYNLPAYRNALYSHILQMRDDDLYSLYLSGNEQIYEAADTPVEAAVDYTVEENTADYASAVAQSMRQQERRELALHILAAYREDLKNRNFDMLTGPTVEEISMDVAYGDHGMMYMMLPVYAEDVHTLAVLNSLPQRASEHWSFSSAVILRCNEPDKRSASSLADELAHDPNTCGQMLAQGNVPQELADRVQVAAVLEGSDAVDALIARTGIMRENGVFAIADTGHIILMNSGQKGEFSWSGWIPMQGALPEEYR